jgi:hypothetical protein
MRLLDAASCDFAQDDTRSMTAVDLFSVSLTLALGYQTMSNPSFEVESLVKVTDGMAVVLARRLDSMDFTLRPGSLLNGVSVSGGEIPRAINDAGQIRFDLWGFFLENPHDLSKFSVGQIVTLTN